MKGSILKAEAVGLPAEQGENVNERGEEESERREYGPACHRRTVESGSKHRFSTKQCNRIVQLQKTTNLSLS